MFEHKNNVRDHFYCVKEIFEIYKTKEQLKSLSERSDIDTVCAFDYHKMKTFALQGHGLHYKDYNPSI